MDSSLLCRNKRKDKEKQRRKIREKEIMYDKIYISGY